MNFTHGSQWKVDLGLILANYIQKYLNSYLHPELQSWEGECWTEKYVDNYTKDNFGEPLTHSRRRMYGPRIGPWIARHTHNDPEQLKKHWFEQNDMKHSVLVLSFNLHTHFITLLLMAMVKIILMIM